MEPIVIGQSRTRWLIFLVIALAFVATGVFMLASGETGFIPWMTIVFFGACALAFAWQLIDNRPRITISDRGIEDRFLKIGVIEWSDIVEVRLWRQQRNAFIGLELVEPQKYISRLSPMMRRMVALNEKLGFPGLNLNLAGTNAVPEHVEALLERELSVRSSQPTD